MINSTLCYLERGDAYLMLHRVKKENDCNRDKWIGIGGKFLDGESPEECALREINEETGLTVTGYRYRGIVTFVSDRWEDEGTTMLAEQFGPCPFKNAKTPANVFFADANAYTAAGNYIVTWAFNWTPAVDDWRAGVVDALTQYTVNGGSWDNVKTAFVDGWATQYAKENG